MLAPSFDPEKRFGRRRSVRKSASRLARSARRTGGTGHGASQRGDPGAHRLRRGHDPGGRQPPDFLRRQAAAADADAGDGQALRLLRRRPYQARRRGRVHAHRDAAARRRGRRKRHAPRQARRPHAVGQRGERAGRRLPARPGLQDDGRGRQSARARYSVVGRRGDRRRRGDAARRRQEHRHQRGRISGGDPRQDRGTVRRRLRGRPGAGRRRTRPSSPPAARSA